MSARVRRTRPAWRVAETPAIRPELWIAAVAVIGCLLVEVWQTSRMAEIGIALDQARGQVVQAEARLDHLRADLERRATRAELDPLAAGLGLEPADIGQVVILPTAYLAERGPAGTTRRAERVAWGERIAQTLVPEATAKSRTGD